MTSSTKRKYKPRTTNKQTNDKSLENYQWKPPRYDPSNVYKYPYHRSFPVPNHITNHDLPISLNKKYSSKLPWKDSYIVICLYRQCRQTIWSKWNGRKPFYIFNTNHHRKIHDHKPYKLQIVSRLTMSKNHYIKEYGLVNHHIQQSPYPYLQPRGYYLCNTQRSANLMNMICNDFLGIALCKKPLNAYLIRELIFWASQSPHFKLQHRYLYRKSIHPFQTSHDKTLVYKQIIRNQKAAIQEQANKIAAVSIEETQETPIIDMTADADDDFVMTNQTHSCSFSKHQHANSTNLNLLFYIILSILFCIYADNGSGHNQTESSQYLDLSAFDDSHLIDNPQQNDMEMTIKRKHHQHLIQTIQTLSQQISTLQASNNVLLQTISTLSTTINAANLPQIMSKLNSVSSKLNSLSLPPQSGMTNYFIFY